MATPDLTAAQVMDMSASLMNDTARTVYTYTAQLPYLRMALDELQEMFELNNVPVTNKNSVVLNLSTGTTVLGFNTIPALPQDLVDVEQVWERSNGQNSYTPMGRVSFLPPNAVVTNRLSLYMWENQALKFIAGNTPIDLRLDYIRTVFIAPDDSADQLDIINGKSFLGYRTGALCAQFIGEDKARADDLNNFAGAALERVIQIGTKGRQHILTKRRPFLNRRR